VCCRISFAWIETLYGKLTKNIRAQVNVENLFDVNRIAAARNNNILPSSPIVRAQ
jgi:catecholate siderophore receptor